MNSKTDRIIKDLYKAIRQSDKKRTYGYDTAAEVTRVDGDTVWVHIPGGIDETPVRMTVGAKKGDIVQVRVSGGSAWLIGNASAPPTDDSRANQIGDSLIVTQTLLADTIIANNVRFNYIEADTAKIHHLEADELEASVAYIHDLTAEHITADDIIADHAAIGAIDAQSITAAVGYIQDLTAENITAQDISADHAFVNNFEGNYAHITNGVIDNAKIGYADVNDLNAHFAEINLANVNNAWITNGVIKNGAISDAMINSVSANKLTAGTIDASVINVANLRAKNLIVEKINGQPILGGYELVSPNSSGYSSKNPSQEGWYEYVNGTFVTSTDTRTVDGKAYYQDGEQVALYDQTYIDGLESNLNDRIDGSIETFTGTVVPTLVNYPAVDWTSAQMATHIGDIYYVLNAASDEDGYCYRFAYDNTSHSYMWVLIKDSDVTAALSRLATAEGDISGLKSFESTTVSWIEETDEELASIKQNHTSLETVVNKTLKTTTQLWYSKANTTAPAKPTSRVTSTSTAGGAWRVVVPAYSASYPNYYYCYQWEYTDGTFGWSDVTRDIAMGEAQSTSRSAASDASSAASAASAAATAANANIKSAVQLWFTKANTTAPAKPTAHVTTNDPATANAWNIAVPTYNASYPYYYYCYEYQKGDNTYAWSDVIYDRATTENQANARSALTQVSTKVETSTFNALSQTVSENSAAITSLSSEVESKADGSEVTSLSNTVNSISQKADSNESKISNLTTVLGTNTDGTTKSSDIVHRVSDVEQDLDGITTRVSKTEAHIIGMYATSSEAAGTAAKKATIVPAVTGWELIKGVSITVKFTNNNTTTTPTLNINSTGAKTIKNYSGSALAEAEYKWKAGSTFAFVYDGTYWRMQDSSALARVSTAETNISQNATDISSVASRTTSVEGRMTTAETNITQNADDITATIGRTGELETLIRAYSGGVLTAKVGNSIGAKVDPDGYFMVVPLTWSGNTPTVGSASLATFGATTRIGAYADNHAYITSNGFSVYTANDAKSRIILGDSSGSPYAQIGSALDSNYLYLSTSGLSLLTKATGESSHTSGLFTGLDGTTPLTRIGRQNDGHISVYPSEIQIYKAGATSSADPVKVASFGSTIRVGAQTARNIYITDTAINFMNNGVDCGYITGDNARFGKADSSRFVIGSSSLQAYNSSNVKYFEVSASGITYGTKTVANTSDIPTKVSELTNDSSFATTGQVSTAANAAENNGKKEATNYIYYVSSTDGIVIADASPSTSTRFVRINSGGVRLQQSANNYATMTSSGLTVFQGGSQVGYFGSASRIGSPNDGNLYVSSSGLNVYKKETGDSSPVSIAFFGVDSGSGYSRIGASAQRHIEITSENGFCLYGTNGIEYFRARDSFIRVGPNANDTVRLVFENNYMNFMYRDSNGTDTIREFIGYSSAQNKWYTLLRGTMTIDAGSIILPNDYSYRMKNSSGTDRTVVTLSSSNSYMFGYGGYSNSEGQSYFDGNTVYMRSKGNISFTAGSSGTISGNKAYTNTSDIRLKEDVEYLGEDTDDIILNLKPFKFHWKDKEAFDSDDHYGVSAQDLKAQLEEKKLGGIVSKAEEHYGVAYSELIPMLIHLCQSQQKEINELKEKIQ